MPLDAICLQALLRELRTSLIGGRIEKVQQPTKEQVVLHVQKQRLLLDANVNRARIHLTEIVRENPEEAPMFCMLLRKHLTGRRIHAIEQPEGERIVRLRMTGTDELGRVGERSLILELIGRRTNLLLLDDTERILGCLRAVGFGEGASRQLLPGLFYTLPEKPRRYSLNTLTQQKFTSLLDEILPGETLDKALTERIEGISPLIAREMLHRAGLTAEMHREELDPTMEARLADSVAAFARDCAAESFVPYLLLREEKTFDFTYCAILQYGGQVQRCGSFSQMLDRFYEQRERQELTASRGRELAKRIRAARNRLQRKLPALQTEFASACDRERLRRFGDLITANLYRMERGATVLRTEDFYDETLPQVDIPLDPLRSPQQNAADYYKRYTKAKHAEEYLRAEIAKAETELQYLESVLQELEQAETVDDFTQIRRELEETGYCRAAAHAKRRKNTARPWEFCTSGGFTVLVGRSNLQNDELTRHTADKRDIWFHTQHIHGSHVILRCAGAQVDERSMEEAAMLAAWFSKARESANVAVDYTAVRNVRKAAGARPGMVLYENYRTMWVTPRREEIFRMKKG